MGYVHSIETMGLVDGPGIRVVVFLQGCKLRCKFCHNPDTWFTNTNLQIEPQELVDRIRKFRPYFEESGGGVTFSGGEPLMQSTFLKEVLKLCKKYGINTCVDTSGTGYKEEDLDEIFKWTDLFLVDVKAINSIDYKNITGQEMNEFNYFLERLNKSNKPVWIRQVIVPTINDNFEYITSLKEYIKKFNNVLKVELLGYHTLGVNKYEKLNLPYSLKGIPDISKDKLQELQDFLNNN